MATRQTATLAQRFIAHCCDQQGIEPGQLVIHSHRGSPMTAKTTAQLLADLGIGRSHSRPHVSNDNPFSEAHFKALKHRPAFPDLFGSQEHAVGFLRGFSRGTTVSTTIAGSAGSRRRRHAGTWPLVQAFSSHTLPNTCR